MFEVDFNSTNTQYNFLGISGSGTTSSSGNNTITETITQGSHLSSVVYTASTTNPSSYQITSVTQGSHTHSVTPSASSPTFSFQYNSNNGSTTVSETVTKSNYSETLSYNSSSSGGSSTYSLSSDVLVFTNPSASKESYSFPSSNSITETYKFGSNSVNHTHTLLPTESLSGVGTSTVTETIISGNSIKVDTFTGSASSGYVLQKVSTTFVPQGSSAAALDIVPNDRAQFDFAAQTVTWIKQNGVSGTPQNLSTNKNISFSDLGSVSGLSGSFVGETITHGSHVSYEIYYSSTGAKGEYMEISHGSGTAASVNLVGLANQITALNSIHILNT